MLGPESTNPSISCGFGGEMSMQIRNMAVGLASALIVAWPAIGNAQVPVDDSGNAIGDYAASDGVGTTDDIPLLSAAELEELVGPFALYPDDLLAIILPASTFPLQLVQAERFLRDLKSDPSLQPDPSWDDSVVALVNYPEAVKLLTDDLDKTWRLGEAVVAQQADVIAAVESFRDRAYAAGNLQSDSRQTVARNDGVIEISPVDDDVIYVPYYEPERVVVYQRRPVYYYYPTAYPVYYYPYPAGYAFSYGYFWGVTTAYTIGWYTNHLHVHHHSYHSHPYYGRSYWNHYWYRRPDIHVHNNHYYSHHYSGNRHAHGDYWRPQSRRTVSAYNQRVTRSHHYPGTGTTRSSRRQEVATTLSSSVFKKRPETRQSQPRSTRTQSGTTGTTITSRRGDVASNRSEVRFRERPETSGNRVASVRQDLASVNRSRQVDTRRAETRPVETRRVEARGVDNRRGETRRVVDTRRLETRPAQPQRAAAPARQERSRSAPVRQQSERYVAQREVRSSQPERSATRSSGSRQHASAERPRGNERSRDRR